VPGAALQCQARGGQIEETGLAVQERRSLVQYFSAVPVPEGLLVALRGRKFDDVLDDCRGNSS
jgi:hypothetical protein